jgi:KaiC/GvpD/RAD55 family RecA-like ATPase
VSEDETAGEKQAPSESETGLAYPVSTAPVPTQKQADLPKTGIFSPVAVSFFPGGCAPVRLARYNRWSEAERALILLGRVERFLRRSCASEEWKKLGIVDKFNVNDLIAFENCLFDPKYWGPNAGVVLRQEFVDNNNKRYALAVGESNLLNLFAQKTGFDLAVCSETERTEMGRLAVIIPPAVLHLMNYYAQHFGISRDLDKPYHEDAKVMIHAAVDPFNLYHFDMSKIVFHGKDRAPQLQLTRLDVAGRTVLLPIRFFASVLNPTLYCMMPEVPDRPALYNADAIAANPGATVILTDELGIPLVNDNDSDYIYSSVYGGMEMIDKLDRDQLEGHPLGWLCFDNGDGPVKMYKKAMRVNAVFQKHGLEIAFFHVFDGVTWTRNAFGMDTGTYKGSRVLSFDELKVEAAKYGIDVGESHACADDAPHIDSMDELMALEPKEFFLYPLLQEGFYCLIYGASGVAKTWFALHIAIALTQGTIPFEGWEFRGKAPLNVLYVAGEMRPEEYGKRINELLAGQKTNPRFGLLREKLDLTTPEHQARVRNAVKKQKSKVVVLDNLSTLADNGHTEKQFKKIHSFIEDFQADGLTVILVHHENREGEFKGSGRISLVADISLHLFRAGNGTIIELLVQPDKARSVSSAEFPPFHTEFDPKNPTAVWSSCPLKPEERCRLDIDDPLGEVEMNIGKKRNDHHLAWQYLNVDERAVAIIDDMLSGCHDDVIAANLAVREIAVKDFKQEHGITDKALSEHLSDAKDRAKKKHGKITTDILALEIWNQLKTRG